MLSRSARATRRRSNRIFVDRRESVDADGMLARDRKLHVAVVEQNGSSMILLCVEE